MCGISGIIYKKAGKEGKAPIGRDLVGMLDSLAHRGKDSSGVTIAGENIGGDYIVRLWTSDRNKPGTSLDRAKKAVSELPSLILNQERWGEYLRLVINYEGNVSDLSAAIVNMKGVELHSIGRVSEVIKDVGTAVDLGNRHGIHSLRGTHGIGHVRMATESKVDISHAHPFWAYPFPDVTVVHNGQLTNYHKLRRRYEINGHHFQTGNDSELIAIYLADKLAQGASLRSALEQSIADLDGTFTYLVSTEEGMGVAKDEWAAKPLVTMETENLVAVASEEVAIRRIFPDELDRAEPQESEVLVWSL